MCFFGYRWFKFVLFIVGFLVGFTIGFFVGGMSPLGAAVGVLAGLLLGLLFRFVYFLGLFVLGALLGALVGLWIAPPAALFFGLVGGILGLIFHKAIVILSTGLVGGFMLVSSIQDLSTGKSVFRALFDEFVFPTQILEPRQLAFVLGVSIAIGLVGIVVQSVTTSHLPARLSASREHQNQPGQFLKARPDTFSEEDDDIIKFV